MTNITNIFIKIFKIDQNIVGLQLPYKKLMHSIAKKLNYTVLKSSSHQFIPNGFTSVLLLSESHISIHTWPEKQFAIFEMVTCKPFLDKEEKVIASCINDFLKTDKLKIVINK